MAGRDDLIERFFAALRMELGRVHEPLELDTLYLGGGTPSHLGPHGLERLFELLHATLRPVAGAEVSTECNPEDVTEPLAAALHACGVTRASLGAQSLDPVTLRSLDRSHSPADVRRAVGLLRDRGLAVNVDLMTAAPGQSLDAVERDLDAVIALAPEHVSVYCLTWEKGTAFEGLRRKGTLVAADDETERLMFEAAIDRLAAAGYEHYEVSNFARPGQRCRHNEAYWDCRPWEAFGPGAARFDGLTRTSNHRSPVTWMNKVLAGDDYTGDIDAMDAEAAARERLVVGLRRRDGVARATFRTAAGLDLDALAGPAIAGWVAQGLATDDGATVRLTRAGLLVSDALWAEILVQHG